MIKRLILLVSAAAFLRVTAHATVIHVPADFLNIQAAINGSANGDTIMVAPGTYTGGGNQNITTAGKAITVTTSGGPLVTFIDANTIQRGFNVYSGEDSTTVLEGFTIMNCYCGVYCDTSGPVIRNMIIKDFLSYGVHFDGFLADPPVAPVVENCLIYQERQDYYGTGIGVHGARSIDIDISGCLFENLTYGMEFHAYDNMPPHFDIDKCILRNSLVDGIWAHS